MNVDLPEVQSFALRPRFYRQGNKDYVEISAVGSKDTNICKVTPEIMAQFPAEWRAYSDGQPLLPRKGTPLTAIPQMTDEQAKKLFDGGVHVLEELAILTDAQCQPFGHGTITLRTMAQRELAKREAARRAANHDRISAAVAQPMPVETVNEDMAKLTTSIDSLTTKFDQLVQVLIAQNAPKPRGRPKKNGPSNTAADSH